MAYSDPGTTLQEVVNPKAGAVQGVALSMCIIGEGNKDKRVRNEQHIRGQVKGEAITFDVNRTSSNFLNVSNQKKQDTVLYQDGIIVPSDGYDYVSANVITVTVAYYSASSVYVVDYVATDLLQDFLDNVNIQRLKGIGLFPGADNFILNTDYQLVGETVDWSIATQVTFTGLNAGPFDLSVNKNINISINGKGSIEIDCSAGAAVPAAVTIAEVAAAINAALTASSIYGSVYGSVASDGTTGVELVAPEDGQYVGSASTIVFLKPLTLDGTNTVFGISTFTVTYFGIGKRPVAGTQFYVTYEYTRVSDEYNTVRHFFSDSAFYNDIGMVNQNNPLSIAGLIAYKMGVQDLYVIQVADSDGDGVYTDTDYVTALQALVDERLITDFVVLKSSSLIRANAVDILVQEASITKSNFKRYWCGIPRDTVAGDIQTAGSIVYIAKNELQVSATSPGRGRFMLCAPANYSMVIVEETGEQVTMELDSCYQSVADVAAQMTLGNVSDSLLRVHTVGPVVELEYSDAERRYLTVNGVNVHTVSGSTVLMFDPVTTDTGGNVEYQEPNASPQKDTVSFKIIDAINENIIGLVPDDLAAFLGSVKTVVGGVLTAAIDDGDIGSYRDKSGKVRDIDYMKDIVALRDANDPTKYLLRYWFELKYVAKRVNGMYSVDNPFWVGK